MSRALVDAAEQLQREARSGEPHIFEASLALVRTAVERLGWGTMLYRCHACGFEWRIWLSLGVEGPDELRATGLYVASPFSVRCPAWPNMSVCDGSMDHTDWTSDETFPPVMIPDDQPRFVLPYCAQRGDRGARLEIPEPALVRARRALNE